MVDYMQLDRAFAALADPTRRAMLERLAKGAVNMRELGAPFGISKQAVSKHVLLLEEAGLLRRVKEGRARKCVLEPAMLKRIERWSETRRAVWAQNFDRLDDFLKSRK